MINKNIKKKNQRNFLLNLLFKSKSFYGESINKKNKDLTPFIYGIRHNYYIINLKYISIFLKRIFKLIEYTFQKKKKILIIGNSDDMQFLINKNLIKKNKNIIFFNQDWVNGLITNYKMNLNSFLNQNKNKIQLIFVIKSSINENYLNKELSTLKVPVISLITTNQNLKNIHYPILSNLNNIQSIYTYLYLIRQIF